MNDAEVRIQLAALEARQEGIKKNIEDFESGLLFKELADIRAELAALEAHIQEEP